MNKEPSIDTRCVDCGGAGFFPVQEDDGDRSWTSGTQCLRCKGTGEDPEWRARISTKQSEVGHE